MLALSVVQAALLVPPTPVPAPAIYRAVSISPATSTFIAEKKALFPEDFQKTINDNLPIIEGKIKNEVAPEVEKLSKKALEGAQVAAKEAEPVIRQAAADLAPIAQEAADVLAPIVLKGLQVAGRELWELTKTVAVGTGEVALQLGTQAAGAAGAAVSDAVGTQYGTVDATTRKSVEDTGKGFVAAATPVVEEGLKAATPIAKEALTTASKLGASALKQGLAKLDATLTEYAASTPAPAVASDPMADKLAAAEAERVALLKALGQ